MARLLVQLFKNLIESEEFLSRRNIARGAGPRRANPQADEATRRQMRNQGERKVVERADVKHIKIERPLFQSAPDPPQEPAKLVTLKVSDNQEKRKRGNGARWGWSWNRIFNGRGMKVRKEGGARCLIQ